MHKCSRVFLVGVLLFSLGACEDNNRVSQSAEEREVLRLVNFARRDPQGFARQYLQDLYNVGDDNGAYEDLMGRSPVRELTLHNGLQAAAVAHSLDMSSNCGMQHNSCDGTSWAVRIQRYYDGGTIAENIAAGYPSARSVVIAWIVDQGIPSLGHRINILNGAYTHIGIAERDNYWTQDFGAGGK